MNGLPIRIESLDVSYGDVPVLRGIDLAVAPGEFIALLGASGCGKTTLLRALAGFIPVAAGRIEVGGEPVGALPPERRNMAMMFQSYALWPHMNTAQNIGYGLRLRRWPKARIAERVRELVALVGLEGLERRNVTRLSGGQRQRVALARALAIDPPILLLDEPLSNLDARIRQNMRHEVRSLQQRLGLTTILVTHDREEAMSMADRMVILDAGRIAQVGTPEAVYQRPASAFVAAFMGAENAYPVDVRRENGAVLVSGPHLAAEARLPFAASLEEIGVHCPAGRGGPMVARFRSEAAALVETDRLPEAHLALSGTVTRQSYLGNNYRHSVRVGEHEFLVDHPRRIAADRTVAICIPAGALNLFEPDPGADPHPASHQETEFRPAPAPAPEAAGRGRAPSTPDLAKENIQ